MEEILFIVIRASVLIFGRIRKRLSGNANAEKAKEREMMDLLWFGVGNGREKERGRMRAKELFISFGSALAAKDFRVNEWQGSLATNQAPPLRRQTQPLAALRSSVLLASPSHPG